jgi:hypothetical protein
MLRTFTKALVLTLMLIGGGLVLLYLHDRYSTFRQIAKLEEEKKQLQQIVQRLESEKRVADVLVSGRKTVAGVAQTTLLFVEYDRQGRPLPARTFTVKGTQVHFDAMVIKFDRDFVEKDDPLRGHSIALFTRVYGDCQTPQQAAAIDEPGAIPAVYRGSTEANEFESELWKNFWRLAEDSEYRKQHGVRIANGQGLWGPFEAEKLYTITIESAGGLNLTVEPVKGIYREAMRR